MIKRATIALAILALATVGFVGCRNGFGGGGCPNGSCGVPYSPSYGPVQPGPVYQSGGGAIESAPTGGGSGQR